MSLNGAQRRLARYLATLHTRSQAASAIPRSPVDHAHEVCAQLSRCCLHSSPASRQVSDVLLVSLTSQGAALQLSREPRTWSQHLWLLGAAAAAITTVRSATSEQKQLDPETVEELARDLHGQHHADRERSVSSLSGLTIYVEYHEALLAAGVLPALMASVQDPHSVPQLRNVALTSAADLMKNKEAHAEVANNHEFLPVVVEALKTEGGWEDGPEDGAIARTNAARLLAELAAATDMHKLLVKVGAASQLASRGGLLAHESMKESKTYASMAAVPGNMGELVEVEEERFTASALFGLSASDTGVQALLQTDEAVAIDGMAKWARSNDPILQRYSVGGLARLAVSGRQAFQAVNKAGGLQALVSTLTSSDGQTACYAAAAIGKLPGLSNESADAVLNNGAAPQLVAMLKGDQVNQSAGVRGGVQRCALNAIVPCLQNSKLAAALQQANLEGTIKALLNNEAFSGNSDLAALSTEALKRLNAL